MRTREGQRRSSTEEREAERHGREVGRDDGVAEGRELGHIEGVRLALSALYGARYGAMPARVREAIEGQEVLTELLRWNALLGTHPREEAERAMLGLDD